MGALRAVGDPAPRRPFLDLARSESLNREMFGFPSLGKLLVLVAIISAIWFAFRLLGQIERNRRDAVRREQQQQGRVKRQPASDVDDLVKCTVCGTFTARSSKACGKTGCPF